MIRNPTTKESIGERLSAYREECGMTIKDVARELQTSQKFIAALEENRFGVFPAKVYARGFLRKILLLYARRKNDTASSFSSLMKEFDVEWDVFLQKEKRNGASPAAAPIGAPLITPRKLAVSVFLTLLIFFIIFLSNRIFKFLRAPRIHIETPQKETVIGEPLVVVRGKTEHESRLTINGREITVDEQGNFNETIELLAGLNVLEFFVHDRFGKTAKEERYVIVK